ncbi:MAG: hypothetical protein O2909_01680 [Chloroflexi bacterium]|nr:hypothetical protein [Chloroflexota bacterium]MDA1218140.1 hypothetical protein [Chloroflexota bacterium]PKB57417.1 MAG: hypothetical protein BZY73_03335 [SAR202 cluster bacterium Casp-Chloro-G3]
MNLAATQQMAAYSSQVSRPVEERSASAKDISSQLQEIAASAENMDNQTKKLQEAIGKFMLNGPRFE